MKRIDLHIHTIPNPLSDTSFNFDMDVLKFYVDEMELDAIAITNHNIFDKSQYELIRKELDIEVFPGIEIDIAAGHMLLIGNENTIDKLDNGAIELKNVLNPDKRHISYEEFIDFFGSPSDYLLIPHYTKKPSIHPECTMKFGANIFCGEVSGHKSFIRLKKDVNNEIVPVLFSDFRASDSFKINNEDCILPVRYTYVDINEITYNSLKVGLQDKNKVFLDKDKSADNFNISKYQITASSKLNLIVGKRSSGKTQLLKEISESTDKKRLQYIEQFEITSSSKPEEFQKLLKNNQENNVEEYMAPIKKSINSILSINRDELISNMNEYLASVEQYAYRVNIEDEYSKMNIFNEKSFNKSDNSSLKDLINNINQVYKNEEYKDIIQKYILENDVYELLKELIQEYKQLEYQYILKTKVDSILKVVQKKLSEKSSKSSINNIDLSLLFTNIKKTQLFNEKIKVISKTNRTIFKNQTGKFTELVEKEDFEQVKPIQKAMGTTKPMSDIFRKFYVNEFLPYDYLSALKKSGIEEGKLYKSLFNIKYSVLNQKGTSISGGETAEFNLLNKIELAKNYDILLMDEPEASFDNEFIKKEIIPLVKKISETTTVFIVTHNNTMGTLMQPNNIIYTYFDMSLYKQSMNRAECFKVYSGNFTDSFLKDKKNDSKSNFDVLLDTMEAGIVAYEERKRLYENLKN